MIKKKIMAYLLSVVMASSFYTIPASAETTFAGGSGSADDPYQIANAEQLAAIAEHLNANFVLTQDIDLSGVSDWTAVGSFVPLGSEGEAAETPTSDRAFSGSLDGKGFTIKNLTLNKPTAVAQGLFGCESNAKIKDLKLENVKVSGNIMVGGLVGFAHKGSIDNVDIIGEASGNVISSNDNTSSDPKLTPNMAGGVAGAGADAEIKNCDVSVTVNIAAGGQNAGLVGGGLEACSVSNCTATGKINAAENVLGVGGVAGCDYAATEFTNNDANNVIINAGENAYLVGGILGYTGRNSDSGNEISGCDAENINITLGNGAERAGGILGGGFFNKNMSAMPVNPDSDMYEMYRVPASYVLKNSTASGQITAPEGISLGKIAGHSYKSAITDCRSTVTINDNANGTDIGTVQKSREEAAEFLTSVNGSYGQLFTGKTFEQANYHYWFDYCAAVMGKANAAATVTMLQTKTGSSIYGQEAVNQFSDNPEATRFNCDFINDLSSFTVSGNNPFNFTINGNLKGGSHFSHTYHYVDFRAADFRGRAFPFYIFETNDNSAGEFKYFIMAEDTPKDTYHLEFRYGSNLKDLYKMLEGPYAYWLAAAFPENGNEALIEDVISLFCAENLGQAKGVPSREETAAFEGRWERDNGAYVVISSDGNMKSYDSSNNMIKEETLYPYSNTDDKLSGVAVAYSESGEHTNMHFTFDNRENPSKLSIYLLADKETLDFKKSEEPRKAGGSSSYSTQPAVSNPVEKPDNPQKPDISNPQVSTADLSDVNASDWFYSDVKAVIESGIMKGTGNNNFEPKLAASRAMIVTILYRLENQPAAASNMSFKDVAAGSWYSNPVAWASGNGLVSGYPDASFSPNQGITRQELAAVLYRYAQMKGYDVSKSVSIDKFSDSSSVKDWAKKPMSWLNAIGVINGVSDTRLEPEAQTSRAQLASMINRFINNIKSDAASSDKSGADKLEPAA